MLKVLCTGLMLSVVLVAQTPNHAPVIRITRPVNHTIYSWNSQVPYSVDVSDAEDGDSKYQEIQNGEVLVRLKYVGNSVQASAYMKQKKFSDTSGLMYMMVSNCFSCHGFKTRVAGPSFQEICKKYSNNSSSGELLGNHILTGSTGIWGKEVMPSHPELNDTLAQKMVQWILTYANDPGLNFFIGLQGVLPLNKPVTTVRSGVFIVTAFYTDHGSSDFPDKRITGSGQSVLNIK
ncbi:MAG TPA: c-type cytochrome [Puia sp.]